MRLFICLMMLVMPVWVFAGISSSQQASLCKAAAHKDALSALMDQWIADGTFNYQQAGAMLSLDCGHQGSLLSVMVKKTLSENLEYAVIGLGVNVDAPVVNWKGKHFSISQYLKRVASDKAGSDEAKFAKTYLKRFHNPEFNPNLLRLTMN